MLTESVNQKLFKYPRGSLLRKQSTELKLLNTFTRKPHHRHLTGIWIRL